MFKKEFVIVVAKKLSASWLLLLHETFITMLYSLWNYKTIYGNYSICGDGYVGGDFIILCTPKKIWIGLVLLGISRISMT